MPSEPWSAIVLTPHKLGGSGIRRPNAQTAEYKLASRTGFVNYNDRGGSMTMRRTTLLALLLLLTAALAVPATGAVAQPSQASAAAASAGADFDNDGFADLGAGAPGENVGGDAAAGAVSALFGAGGGLGTAGGQLFTQVGGAVEDGDFFGATLATGDFNQNGFADLAVGAPFEDVGPDELAGAVSVLYGAGGG